MVLAFATRPDDGRPDFNLLQNFRSAESRIMYYAFDILISGNLPARVAVWAEELTENRTLQALQDGTDRLPWV